MYNLINDELGNLPKKPSKKSGNESDNDSYNE